MERNHNNDKSHRGALGWLGIAAYVVLWDTTQPESLTGAFHRGMENRAGRPFVLAGLGITALHLLDLIPHSPRELDPFYIAARTFVKPPEVI